MDPAPRSRLGRYELLEVLGEGGMGVVHRARDLELDREVALKTINRRANGDAHHLEREYRMAAGLRHPNLARYWSLEAHGDVVTIAMELVEDARTFVDWVRPGRLDPDRLADALAQLIGGLRHLHRHGLLHRDVKPSNVLVGGDGRVVLVDFGLARPSMLDEWGLDASLEGTPMYLAPERALGAPSDGRADLYSVGVMLYEALAGEPPEFEETGRLQLLARRPVLHPERFDARTPSALRDLCLALLHSRPEARPDAEAILATLGREVGEPEGEDTLVGRETQLEALHRQREAVDRRPVVFGLHGPAGIGKSALVGRFATELREQGVPVLEGRCREHDGLPYQGFDDVFAQLVRQVGTELDAGEARTLLRLTPGTDGRSFRRVESRQRARAYRDLGRVLAGWARDRKPVLILEDQHWRDPDSEALLDALVTDPTGPRALFVLTGRAPDPRIASWAAAGLPCAAHAVPALDEASAREVLGRDDPAAIVRARGNPWWLRQLRQAGGSVGFDEALDERLRALPDASEALMEVLALTEEPLPPALALEIAEADAADLTLLQERELVRVAPHRAGALEIEHALIRAHVARRIDGERSRTLHLALARARLEAVEGGDAVVVHHLAAAGHHREAAAVAARAASRASESLAFDAAARLWAKAIELGIEDRRGAQRARARALAAAGRTADAARLFVSLGDDAARRRAAEIHLGAGRVDEGWALLEPMLRDIGVRAFDQSLPALLRIALAAGSSALRALRPARPSDAERLRREVELCYAAGRGFAAFHPNRSGVFFMEGLRRAVALGDPAARARGLGYAAMLAAFGGADRLSRLLFGRARRLAERSGDAGVQAWVTGLRGTAAVGSARWLEGVRLLEESLAAYVRIADSHWDRMAAATTVMLGLRYLGRYEELELRARAIRHEGALGDDLLARVEADRYLSLIDLVRDRRRAADERLDRSLDEWPTPGVYFQHWHATFAALQSALYAGRPERARALLGRFPVRGGGLWSVGHVRIEHARGRAMVALALGDRVEAERAARALDAEGQWAEPFAALVRHALGRSARLPVAAVVADLRGRGMDAHADAAELLFGRTAVGRRQLAARGVVRPDRFAPCLVPAPLSR